MAPSELVEEVAMGELTLVGLHEDGEHVVVQGADGQRFRLRIDDALRAAVRRDRPRLEQARVETTHTLPPREIQARIRAGATAEEVAEAADMPLEIVRRYEGPVLAERAFVAQQAQGTRIGHDPDAPPLGELVTDRLATRGVPSEEITWDASRSGSGPWVVEVRFAVGDDARTARWRYDPQARTLRAEDDEARWLSETELLDGPVPRRHLAAVRPEVGVDAALRPVLATVDLPPEPVVEPEDPRRATEELLDDLSGRRGTRQELEVEDDDDQEFEGFGPQHAFDFENPDLTLPPAAHPPHSRPHEAVDATILPMPTPARRPAGSGPEDAETPPAPAPEPEPEHAEPAQEHPAPARPRGRKGRASVPSWDEIVFGAKSD